MASNEQAAGDERTHSASSSPADEFKQGAREFAGVAKEAVERRKNAAAEYIEAVAVAFDCGARELQQKGQSETASLARTASGQLEAVARRMTTRQPRELLDDLQAFARRQPALCFGIAALAGFGLVRFLKSSADRANPTPGRQTGTWRH